MQIDIKTTSIEPLRQTFDHVAARIGPNKAASRYQEATLDIQPVTNFHYLPLWDPEYELYDTRRTAVKMKDWYTFKDPRQYYYGTYTVARAKMQDTAEKSFDFAEKRDLLAKLPEEVKAKLRAVLLPLRHLEWGANMNNCYATDFGYGTAITQCAIFCAMDRLGIAQYISRIGLLLDGNDPDTLSNAKQAWLDGNIWREVRHYVEDMLVTKDWFEVLLAQNIVLDGLVYPLIYRELDAALSEKTGNVLSILTEFMTTWYAEQVRWTDALVKSTAAESAENKALLTEWYTKWANRAAEVLLPLAQEALGEEAGTASLDKVRAELDARMKKQGLAV